MRNPKSGTLWSHPDFRKLLLTGLVMETLRQLETLAVAVFVFQQTGSPFYVAMMLFIQRAPLIPFGLAMGVIADRFNRKVIFVVIFVILVSTAGTLGVLAAQGIIQTWHVAAGVFINGVVWITDFSVRRPMLAESVDSQLVGRAIGVDGAIRISALAFGPAIGGLIFQVLGMQGIYFFACGAYAALGLLALSVRYQRPITSIVKTSFSTDFRLALSYAQSRRVLVGILLITMIVDLWATPVRSMIPVIGEDKLSLSSFLVGVLVSAQGAGALIGAILVMFKTNPMSYGRVYFYGSILYLLAALAFSLSGWFVLSFPVVLVGGIGLAFFSTTQSALVLMAAPPEMRSRMLGLLAVGIGIGPVGILNIGLMASWFGAPNAVTIVSIEGLIAMGFAALLWPAIRRGEDVSQNTK
jgi:MFS family permease